MGSILGIGGGGPPPPDPRIEQERLAAERKANEEKKKLLQQQYEEKNAIKRGLRGRAALLSSGGELGYSADKLGG